MLKNSALTLVLAMLAMVGAIGIDSYLPSFPAIIADLQTTPVAMQMTLSIYIGVMAVTVLFAGTLSDATGRRPLILGAMAIFGASSVLAIFAGSIETLIVARALQGIGAGVSMVLSRTVVQDRFSGAEAQRVMSLITMVFSIAPAVAPVIGGWLQASFGWHSVFVMMAVYALTLWAICQWGLPESLPAEQRTPLKLGAMLGNIGQAVRTPAFTLRVLGIALTFGGIPVYISSASAFIIDILGKTETDFGWLFIPLTIGTLIGASIARKLARRVAAERLTNWGAGIALLATVASVVYTQLFTVSLPWAILPILFYTLGMSIAIPGMTVNTLNIFPKMRGLAASLQSFTQMGLFSLISAFLAPLVFHSAQSLALAHLGCVLLGAVFWVVGTRLPVPAQPDAAPAHKG